MQNNEALILRLRDEISLLKEENRQLREALAPAKAWPRELGLTKTEKSILNCLLASAGRSLSKFKIHDWLYSGHSDSPGDKIIDIYICKIRKKLKPYDVIIDTDWGSGYYIDLANAQKLQNLVEKGFLHETV